MRMEQYLTHTDYALWEVIVNGDAPAAIASVSGGAKAAIPPKTTAEKIARRTELKAKNLEQINNDDLEEMDLKWQSYQAKEGPTDFALMAFLSSGSSSSDTKVRDNSITELKNKLEDSLKEKVDLKLKLEKFETSCSNLTNLLNSLLSSKDKTGLGYDSQLTERDLSNKINVFESASDSSVNESKEDNNQATDRYKVGEGYHVVPPPYTRNFIPPRPNLSFAELDASVFKSAISKPITSVHETETSTSKTSMERKSMLNNKGKATGQRENFVPTTVITKSSKLQVNATKQSSSRAASSTSTARYVNTSANRPIVNVDALGMTGNKSFLTDYQEIDGGFVAFGGSPKGGGLTCLFVKATIDESNLWHRRLGHINFKSMNKFKEKQHKASCKPKLVSSISQPLQMLHMDLFGLTFVKSLNNKMYCLVVTDDFSRKADEGFLVGHSVNSKAFRVFNSRTTRVKENPHIKFLENKPNIAERGPEWLFDIDSLTYSMNYEPVTAKNQTNNETGIEINANAWKAGQEKASNHEYILLPFMPSSTQSSDDKDAGEVPDKGDEGVSKRSGIDDQEKTDNKPKKVIQALADLSWIESMQEELFQFKLQKVWTLVDLPNGKRAIRTKWVFRNKKDERGIVVRNKARLVAQGYTQEEGIDYDEVFTLVARIEAIRIFLAYASFMRFIVYQMDVKSAFLYGTIEVKVYVCQPLGFKDLYFHNKVYKVEKDLYGLHQAPRACQDKYVADILKKFNLTTVKTTSTLMEPNKTLIKDAEAEDVLSYTKDLTSSCYEENLYILKRSHKLGLWYPRDSPFDLEAFPNSEYAGASLNRKSTTGEACCCITIEERVDVAVLDLVRTERKIKNKQRGIVKTVNDDVQRQALVDGKKVVVNKASIRRDLRLDDAEGTACLPTAAIFEELTRISYEKPSHKLTFDKAFFSPQ
nr:retrovirus-related Pol polyprotein from transposon TNT 1-94 [Tanacetum cinerariifolium]